MQSLRRRIIPKKLFYCGVLFCDFFGQGDFKAGKEYKYQDAELVPIADVNK
jgi:hypothetical protein